MRLFTDNWEYKVISLFFAIALYFYFSDQISIGKTLRIEQLGAENVIVPPGWVVTDVAPNSGLEVTIRGPKSLLTPLPDTVEPRIALSERQLARGRIALNVTPRMLELDPKIRVEQVSPVAEIEVQVEVVVQAALSLSEPITVLLPEGLGYRVRLEQTDFLVQGPASTLRGLQRLDVAPVDLTDLPAGLDQPRVRTIPLTPELPPRVTLVDEQRIMATIEVTPEQAQKVVTVPVRVVVPPDFATNYRVSLGQEEVTVTVRGPQALLDSLNPTEQLRATVDIDPVSQDWSLGQSRNLPVQFSRKPSWLSTGSVQVRATLDLAEPDRPTPPPAPAPVEDPPPEPDAGQP